MKNGNLENHNRNSVSITKQNAIKNLSSHFTINDNYRPKMNLEPMTNNPTYQRYTDIPKVNQISFQIKNPEIISNREILKHDLYFNPITQKYSNPEVDKCIKQNEKLGFHNFLTKSYDKQLQYESKYNVINQSNKFGPLAVEQNQETGRQISNKLNYYYQVSNANYNLLSNKPLSEQHFLKPEERPIIADLQVKCDSKRLFERVKNNNFNILSGEYRENHDLKSSVDKKVQLLEAAKIYYENNPYNIFTNNYTNENLNEEIVKKEQDKINKMREKSFKILPQLYKK